MADDNGWIKLHRKSLDSSVFDDADTWKVWCWCLMKANHEPADFPFNGKDMHVDRGQFITGQDIATKELHMSIQKWRTRMFYLKSTGRITRKVTSKFSLISIVKYGDYQDKQLESTGKVTSNLTSQQQASNRPVTTNKNEKNEKKINTIPFSKEKEEENTNAHQGGNTKTFAERMRENPPLILTRP